MTDTLTVRRGYRLREWAETVARCRESGMNNREFCRENGIPEKTFYYRLRQLQEATIDQTPKLVELEDPTAPKGGMLRIQYRGASLELPENIDMEALASLLRFIQSC